MDIMKQLIIASVFLVPLASMLPMAGTIVWYPQLLALIAFGLICIALKFWDMNKYISLLLIYEIFSYLIICQQNPRTMLCLMLGLSGIALAYTISRLENTKLIYKCICGFAIFQSLYVILQGMNIDYLFHGFDGRADTVGFVGSHNQLGVYYVASGVLLAGLNPFLSLFAFIPIYLAKQYTALIGLTAGLLVFSYLSHNRKMTIGIVISLCLLAVPFYMRASNKSTEVQERWNLWKLTISQSISGNTIQKINNGIREVRSNPLFGYGLGNFFVYSPASQWVMWNLTKTSGNMIPHFYEHAHNDLVEVLYELGIAGLLLVLLAIYRITRDFISIINKTKALIIYFSTLIALSVSSMAVYVFHAPVSLYMFCLILGLFYREVHYANQSKITKIA